MKSELPIGIFDSGIGGLTVAREIIELMPNEKVVYFGDTLHLPYGEKSKASIQKFSRKIINFLLEKKCKLIVIACNSASSFADKSVTKITPKTSIINVIDPVIEEIIKMIILKNLKEERRVISMSAKKERLEKINQINKKINNISQEGVPGWNEL